MHPKISNICGDDAGNTAYVERLGLTADLWLRQTSHCVAAHFKAPMIGAFRIFIKYTIRYFDSIFIH